MQLALERFHDLEDNNLITQATILDPRFKKFGFIDHNKFKRAVEYLYTKVANTTLETEHLGMDIDTHAHEENVDGSDIQHCTSEKEDILQGLWKDFDMEVKQYLTPSNPRSSAIIEVDKYLEEPILQRKDSSGISQDPLVWWHQQRHIYPKLYKIMKTRVCIMATSVPCERIFSKAGQIVNERRERLKTDKISQVIFLSYNLNNNN